MSARRSEEAGKLLLRAAGGSRSDEGRGQTLAKIAALVEVDVREIQAALRRARAGGNGGHRAAGTSGADSGSTLSDAQGARTDSADPTPDVDDRRSRSGDGAGHYDPTRCIRCDAVMLDADNAPRRGRRRVYCSDTCRRDASAARTAAERYGSPIRVVEVPRAGFCVEQTAENALPESSPRSRRSKRRISPFATTRHCKCCSRA